MPARANPGFPHRGRPFAALVGGLILALAGSAAGRDAAGVTIDAADRPRLAEEIRGAMARYDSATAFPLPALDDERIGELFDGEVVRFREKWRLPSEGEEASERHRVLAFRLIRAPRIAVWLSTLDPHFKLNDSITEVRLDEDTGGTTTWYQYMDLPWPVRNRHWVIRVDKGVEVCAKTGGETPEQSWHLVPNGEQTARDLAAKGGAGGLSLDKVRGARYLEANDGAWAVFALDDDLTLIAYNLTIVLGGLVPEGMAARFAQRALEELMDRIAANVAKLPEHYVDGHAPIYAGDGTEIPRGVLPAEAK